jgi:hypothetical protein
MEQYRYFMLRLEGPQPGQPGELSGVVERLGTGEKQPFRGVAQLIRILGGVPDPPKMVDVHAPGNM